MSRKSNEGGCLLIIIFVIFMAVIAGARGCTDALINGDIKLPKLGSSKVSGGSGSYGSSNGYNVKYQNSTSPNLTGSQEDYSSTNGGETEYKESPTLENALKEYEREKEPSTKSVVVCPTCNGSGKKEARYTYTPVYTDGPCRYCSNSQITHYHTYYIDCTRCNGAGIIEVN